MNLIRICLITIFIFTVQAKPHQQCDCGLTQSEDVCGVKKCIPLVVRPHEVPKPILHKPIKVCVNVGGTPPMPPIGGPCQCSQVIVRPGYVPKPVCTHQCTSDCEEHHKSLHEKHSQIFGGFLTKFHEGRAGYRDGSGFSPAHGYGDSHEEDGSGEGYEGAGGSITSVFGSSGSGSGASILQSIHSQSGSSSSSASGLSSLIGASDGGSSNIASILESSGGSGGSGGLAALMGGSPEGVSRLSAALGVVGGLHSHLHGGHQIDDDDNQGQLNPAHYVPADPVSLAIAYKNAQRAFTHREDQLSFGFRKLPKELPAEVAKPTANIPEENLYSINGEIVELKPIVFKAGKSVDEEAAEELLELAEEEELEHGIGSGHVKKLTLGEVGYGLAKNVQTVPFINVPVANPLRLAAGNRLHDAKERLLCHDGHHPGTLHVQHVNRPEYVEIPRPLPEPCSSREEVGDDDGEPPAPIFPFFHTSSSHSSSSSHSAHSSHTKHPCKGLLF